MLGMADDRTTASLGDVHGQPGGAIGPYRLLSVLGEGGFGLVWLAEQREPVERRVALKVIRPGIDPQRVLARFEAEGQALAMMDHPGVAKVLDAGLTAAGLPYFALEYVRGTSITEFCDAEGLGVEGRVRLMIRVCEAVHHAHMKGVVHRDLKPGNILVEMIDGKAAPKVIDFGIAKALHRPLTDRPLHTEAGQVLGTPEYMSPEQARGGTDVDTRADVYSLGAILYELLTGTTPMDTAQARGLGLGAVLRQIEEVEPQKPSTRVATLGAGGTPDRSAARGASGRRTPGPRVDPATLSRRLRGELDWIAMKCLEKERSRRYDSAAAMARDLERYLSDEAVEAGPPSAAYRMSKFVRRNRALVAVVAIAFMLLAGATVATGWGLSRAERERESADRERLSANLARESAERDRATAVRERARAEAESAEAVRARDEAEAVTSFLARMLESVEPDEQGRDVSVRAVLDGAAGTVGEEFARRPLIEARLRQVIGNAYRGLGLQDLAEVHLTTALEILTDEAGERDPRTLRAMMNLAGYRHEQGRYQEAAALGERAIAGMAARGEGESRMALGAMNNLAMTLSNLGRTREAAVLMQQVAGLQERVQGPDHPHALGAMSNAALMLEASGDLAGAERLHRQAAERWTAAHGPEHPGTLLALGNLAGIEVRLGRAEEGLRLYQQVHEARRRVLGEEHPDTARARINVAWGLDRAGRVEEAAVEHVAAWDGASRVLGEHHRDTLTAALNLAEFYARRGWPEGSRDRMEVLCESIQRLASEPGLAASELNGCAWILLTVEPRSLRDPATALVAAERACALERAGGRASDRAGEGAGESEHPAAGPSLWEYLDTLALARFRTGNAAGAIEAQREALALVPAQGEWAREEMEARLAEFEARDE